MATDLARPDEAESLILAAEAAVARAGSPVIYQADLISSRAAIATSRGDQAAALTLYEEEIGLLETSGARTPGAAEWNRLFMAVGERAQLLSEMRRSTDAIPAFEDTISLVVRKYGPAHPFLVSYYINASQAYFNAGDHSKAIERAQQAAAIAEARMAASPLLALPVYNVATLLVEEQRFAQALPYLERTLALARASPRPDHSFIADIMGDQGVALVGLGRREEGRALIVESLAMYEKNARPHQLGPDPAGARRCGGGGETVARSHHRVRARAHDAGRGDGQEGGLRGRCAAWASGRPRSLGALAAHAGDHVRGAGRPVRRRGGQYHPPGAFLARRGAGRTRPRSPCWPR
ncbi:MAG: tetratricopeptide repeat protein [Myxococcales bacterium]|nr:tetratricopeptide repeat protein [Myxococcales bacterium]